ncbi:periplasmic chaperone for outer membrane proteins SurA [Cohaesibacter sp. ES.047]|nr:periplasmic chaperone for outer membrane proteins SurA [Cohaesibacter sp. ES.047]
MFNDTMPKKTVIFLLTAAILITAGMVTRSYASRIVAVVNRAAITDLDVTQRQKLERILSGGRQRMGKGSALNTVIDDKLKLFEARDRNATASDREIDAALDNMAKSAKISRSRLINVFRSGGVSESTLREWLKTQISWRTLIRARYNAQIRVEEAEIANALSEMNEDKDKVENAVQFDITSVTFVTRKKANNSEQRRRLSDAKRFRTIFKSCATGLDAARRLTDVAVVRLGRRDSTDLNPEMAKRLFDTPLNSLTPPTKIDNGYEMLAVCGKKDLGKRAAMRSEVESELKNERGAALTRKYLQELRSRAIVEKR